MPMRRSELSRARARHRHLGGKERKNRFFLSFPPIGIGMPSWTYSTDGKEDKHFGGLGPGKKGCLGPGDMVSGDFMTISTTMSGAPKAAQPSARV